MLYALRSREEITSVSKTLDSACTEHLSTAARLLKEGLNVPLLRPWRADPSLLQVQVAANSALIEAQAAVELVLTICDHRFQLAKDSAEAVGAQGEEQELVVLPTVESPPRSGGTQGTPVLTRAWSVSLMQRGNYEAIWQLFNGTKGER